VLVLVTVLTLVLVLDELVVVGVFVVEVSVVTAVVLGGSVSVMVLVPSVGIGAIDAEVVVAGALVDVDSGVDVSSSASVVLDPQGADWSTRIDSRVWTSSILRARAVAEPITKPVAVPCTGLSGKPTRRRS